ncbi:deoxyribonuclease IV [bacterium]|nr:deoxyribonuclease IV [bacterium]
MAVAAFGAHVSIAGGVHEAVSRASEIGCDTFQVFVKQNRQWRLPNLTAEGCAAFRAGCASFAAPPVAHASYLLNLASPNPDLRAKSAATLAAELTACDRLGIRDLVLHPGSHGGDGEEEGLRRIAAGLFEACDLATGNARVALESTAGTGFNLGWRLEHLAYLLEAGPSARLAVCLDTCHLWAAGYDLGDPGAVAAFGVELADVLGWERVCCVHLNDSRHGLGSRKDRHAHIGHGAIGVEGFRAFLALPRVRAVPGIIETQKKGGWPEGGAPAGEKGSNDEINLRLLRRLSG